MTRHNVPPFNKRGKNERKRAHFIGRRAEWLTMGWLMCQGYRLLAHNLRLPQGEIDLVMRRGDLLIFIEVKYRADNLPIGASVSPQQWRRIAACATQYVGRHQALQQCQWRFDQFLWRPWRWPQHRKNVWRVSGGL